MDHFLVDQIDEACFSFDQILDAFFMHKSIFGKTDYFLIGKD